MEALFHDLPGFAVFNGVFVEIFNEQFAKGYAVHKLPSQILGSDSSLELGDYGYGQLPGLVDRKARVVAQNAKRIFVKVLALHSSAIVASQDDASSTSSNPLKDRKALNAGRRNTELQPANLGIVVVDAFPTW